MGLIQEIIINNPVISDIRKQFYTFIIQKRIEKILEPAYIKASSCDFSSDIIDCENISDDFEIDI